MARPGQTRPSRPTIYLRRLPNSPHPLSLLRVDPTRRGPSSTSGCAAALPRRHALGRAGPVSSPPRESFLRVKDSVSRSFSSPLPPPLTLPLIDSINGDWSRRSFSPLPSVPLPLPLYKSQSRAHGAFPALRAWALSLPPHALFLSSPDRPHRALPRPRSDCPSAPFARPRPSLAAETSRPCSLLTEFFPVHKH
jgi:hypothetical protein